MNKTADALSVLSRFAGPVLLTCSFAATVYGLRSSDVWNAHFSETGLIYVGYHLLKSLFFLLMSWIIYHFGHLCLRYIASRRGDFEGSDDVVNCSLAGAAILSVVVLTLGFIHALYFPLLFGGCLVILASSWGNLVRVLKGLMRADVLRVLLPRDGAHRAKHLATMLLWVLVAATGSYIFLAKGLGPDVGGVGGEAISFYIPYFQEIGATHSLWPAVIVPTYFVVKGTGLLILFSQLADVQSLQLATCFYFFLIAVMLYRAVRLTTGSNALFPLLAVLALLSNLDTFVGNFSKSHITNSAYIIALAWYSICALLSDRTRPSDRAAFLLVALNAGLLPLIIVFFCGTVMGVFGIAAFFIRRTPALRSIARAGLTLGVATIAMCWANYLITGVFDATGITAQFRIANQGALHAWASPLLVILYQYLYSIHNASLSVPIFLSHFTLKNISYFFWDPIFLPFLAVVPMYIVTIVVGVNKAKRNPIMVYMVPACICILIIPFLCASFYVNDHYFSHGTVYFKIFFKIFVYTSMLASIVSFFNRGIKQLNYQVLLACFVVYGASISILFHYPHNMRDDMREVFEFTSGRASYESRYSRFYLEIPLCQKVMRDLPGKDGLVLPCNHLSDCNGLPGSVFIDSQSPPYGGEFDMLFTGPLDSVKKMLSAYNIRYFLLQLKQEPNYFMFLQLLSPDSLKERLKVVKDYGDGVYLLTWKEEGDQTPLSEAFESEFSRYRGTVSDSQAAKIVNDISKISQTN